MHNLFVRNTIYVDIKIIMPKQSGNPLWDYFKVNDEDASKAV